MKKRLVIGGICLFLLLIVGATYAFFSYVNTGEVSEIITGEIYMNYEETNNIHLTNAFPETKEKALSRTTEDGAVFEFSITGRNTSEFPIYYEIDLMYGDPVEGRTNAIDPKYIMIHLERDGEVLIDGQKYNDWNNKRAWVDTIDAGTMENITQNYVLRMWIDENVTISDTDPSANYTTSIWNDSYASLKIRVLGNLEEKSLAYNNLGKKGSTYWPSSIDAQKNNVTAINFVSLPQSEIDTRFESASIKEDVSADDSGSVKAWLESDNNNGYIMYVASDGVTYFPEDSSYMFRDFRNLTSISFGNINTSKVTNMYGMFYYCMLLPELDLSKFDTSQVTDMSMMFYHCRKVKVFDLVNFNTENVTDMSYMFWAANATEYLNLSSFDTRNVETLEGMFGNLYGIKEINLNSFYTDNLKNLCGIFYECNGLESIYFENLDTSRVTDMSEAFSGCYALTKLDLSNWDISSATNLYQMFYNCPRLSNLDISNFNFNTSQYSSYEGIFATMPSTSQVTVGTLDAQNWILNLSAPSNRPEGWSTSNVVVKTNA